MPLPKILNGIDGVGFSGSRKFNVSRGKKGIICGGQPHHFEPVLSLDDQPCHFMWWNGRWDEMDLLEVERLSNFLGPPEVTQMDRIEGPS
jgi:hypothetical protein